MSMKEQFRQLGLRIREMREISGLDTAEVAKDLGISAEIYENYEESGENIPISVLYDLSVKFGVDMTELLTGQTPRLDDFYLVRKGTGTNTERFPGYNFQSLAHRFMNKMMEPLLVRVDPTDTDPELVVHKGQEFNMVLEGRVMVIFDDKRMILEPGDSIYFNSAHPHGQKAMDNKSATFLTVITE